MADAHSDLGHDHGDHGHGDDHGHHGGEAFVPANSPHDLFLQLVAVLCLCGLVWMMYFWQTGVPLAEVAEHEGSLHTEHSEITQPSHE